LPGLELVLSLAAGLEKVDVEDFDRRGIAVAHTADEFTEDVADYALGLIFAPQRNVVAADRFVRSGARERARFMTSRRMSNRSVGIVGQGRIGNRSSRRCSGCLFAQAEAGG
jgi:hydroxypyruvate reductase